jgi:hypothetical protein
VVAERKEWEPMVLREVGDIHQIVLNVGGQGKSGVNFDSGDPLKPPGLDNA